MRHYLPTVTTIVVSEARTAELQQVVANLRAARRLPAERRYETEFWVIERDARVRVPAQIVDRFEAYGDYVRLHVGARSRLLRATLNEIENRIDPSRFVRIHRSQIVRSDLISGIRRTASGRMRVVLTDGSEHRVSRSHCPALRARVHGRDGT